MRRTVPILALLTLTACATTTQQPATTSPTPVAATPRAERALTPVATPAPAIAEPSIRVGLLIDQATVVFPRTEAGYLIATEAGVSRLRRGFTAEAPLAGAAVRYAVQMAAISDESSARALAERIRTETGMRVDMNFDPAGGMYRILAGDFASSEEATPARAKLVEQGYGTEISVTRRPASQEFTRRIALIDDEGDRVTFEGASLQIFPASGDTLTLDKQPYRTSAILFVNDRGLLNVINRLNLEDYLLGVVPAEMGPTIYDQVEALKAQAVAARTYAVRNLRQFEREGYDICPGPACQAYKGFGGEHALSSRAVRETAGLVLTHEGKMIDALYSATCGGETSDVATMFPGRNEPYLKAVRCVELDMLTLEGRADSGLLDELQVDAALFASVAGVQPGTSWSAADVARTVAAAAKYAGFPFESAGAPRSSRRGDVLTWLATALRLEEKGRVLLLPEDRRYFFPQSSNTDSAPFLAAAFLIKYGIDPSQYIDRVALSEAMPRTELHALLGSWLREQNLLREGEGKIAAVDGRRITVENKGERTAHILPAGIPIYRELGGRWQEYRQAPLLLGDRTRVVLAGSRPVALVIIANYDGAAFDRTSSFSNWTRSYRASELVTSISRRNPIRQLVGIRPVEVDESERVAALEVTAEGGRTFVLRGLPVRWSLNLPDNLFVYDVTTDPDGQTRYTFYGKGWGHGTGMCQVGAYGAAFRGWTFDRILRHYYTGVEVVPMAQATR